MPEYRFLLLKGMLLTLLLFFLLSSSTAQPSTSVTIKFKLYDQASNLILRNDFCKKFQTLGAMTPEGRLELDENCWKGYANYDTTFFHIKETVVYNNVKRSFVFGKDTMDLIFNTNAGTVGQIQIDSLIFLSGQFLISTDSRKNSPPSVIKNVDYVQSAIDYYNSLLYLGQARRGSHFENDPDFLKLKRLQKKYKIAEDDYEEKKFENLSLDGKFEIAKYLIYSSNLTADQIAFLQLQYEDRVGEENSISYYWNSKELLLNTNDSEHLTLFSDSTFYYQRICPNLDHSTDHYSMGNWKQNGKYIYLNSFGSMDRGMDAFVMKNRVWKKKGLCLKPDDQRNDWACNYNTLKTNRKKK